MTVTRLVAIGCIYALACGGWWILGTTTSSRSSGKMEELGDDVEALWGRELVQEEPSLVGLGALPAEAESTVDPRKLLPSKSEIQVHLRADPRRKGLVWYPTYVCSFDGRYTIGVSDEEVRAVGLTFPFPTRNGTYDDFLVTLDGERLEMPVEIADELRIRVEVAPGQSRELRVAYTTRGIHQWRYQPARDTGRVRDLSLEVTTSFRDVDYPEGALSPMLAEPTEGGMRLVWKASDLITQSSLGVVVPRKLNPGPLTSRITFFAPVCLGFFFLMVTTIAVLYGIQIHPMHYLFVAAGFFSFHLLLSYLADVVAIHVAFLAATVMTLFLVTSYLSAALRGRFPWKVAVGGQAFFLVLFSYSFFLNGVTGLVVVLGCILTLAFLMRVTAHVDWERVFARPEPRLEEPAPSAPAAG